MYKRQRLISEEIVRAFLDRELDEVRIFYTEMQSAVAIDVYKRQGLYNSILLHSQ